MREGNSETSGAKALEDLGHKFRALGVYLSPPPYFFLLANLLLNCKILTS